MPILLSLGSNIGDRLKNISDALVLLRTLCKIKNISCIYETEPWGNIYQDHFYNIVIEIETELPPFDFFYESKSIEKQLGREASPRWSPRIIDIDILFWNEDMICSEVLTIPHKSIADRKFVLIPCSDIFPDFVHPFSKKSIIELLNDCNDKSEVLKIDERIDLERG